MDPATDNRRIRDEECMKRVIEMSRGSFFSFEGKVIKNTGVEAETTYKKVNM